MKKKANPLVPAAALLAILCAAYGLITWQQGKAAKQGSQPEDSQIYITDMQGLSSIRWDKDGQGLELVKENEAWHYGQDKECPIRQYTVTTLADTLSRLEAERVLKQPDSPESYGLNPPAMTFDLKSADGSTQTLMIGNQVAGTGDSAPGYGGGPAEYYASLRGGSQVFTIGSYLAETADKGLYDFIETETLPYVTGADIKEITVTKDGSSSTFSKKVLDADNNIAWYKGASVEEAGRLPDNAALNNLAEAISGLSIQSCVSYKPDEKELEAYGLSSPRMTLSWTYQKGEETGTITLAIGGPEEETGYYTRMDGSRAVNLIAKDAVEKCLNAGYPE